MTNTSGMKGARHLNEGAEVTVMEICSEGEEKLKGITRN